MRFERMTLWLKVKCSTSWANEAKLVAKAGFEPTREWVKVICVTTSPLGKKIVVEGHGFEPWNPKEQIYSLPRLTTSLSLQKKDGAENRNWTRNLLITSQLLYQLSYFGTKMVGDIGLEPMTPCL